MNATLTLLVRASIIAVALSVSAMAAPAKRSPAPAVLAGAAGATWVAEGEGRRIVYVFFDPNCPSCQLLYRNLRTFIASGDLQVRWIPVALIDPTSLGKAAAILEAPDPAAALRHNEERYDAQAHAGGIEEQIPSAETERRLRFNERLFNRLDIPVVPSMLFAAKDGRTVLIQGALSPIALRKVFDRLPQFAVPTGRLKRGTDTGVCTETRDGHRMRPPRGVAIGRRIFAQNRAAIVGLDSVARYGIYAAHG